MPPKNPRIVVVDDNKGIYNIVRASLELLARRPRLIETQTADDALLEIRVASPDLLITAHSLSGTTNGPVLALMAKRELAALPIDLLAATLGPGFGSTSKILPIVGDQPRVLKYYDGAKLDLFGLAVGLHHFITLIFDNKVGSTLGNVKRFGGNAVNEMIEVIGVEKAFSVKPVAPAAPGPAPAKPAPAGVWR